jgi:hypothetical protein
VARMAAVRVRHRHVDVQRVNDLEPSKGAQLLLHPPVALTRGEPLDEGVRGRVQPRGRDPHPCLSRRFRDLAPKRGQSPGQLRDVGEHGRAHLQAVLKELSGINSELPGVAPMTSSIAGANSPEEGSTSWNSSSTPTV